MLSNPITFLYQPQKQWQAFAEVPAHKFNGFILYPLIMALIPSFSWFYGTTQVGWSIGGDESLVRLTELSAAKIAILMYIAIVMSVIAIGYSVHWMATTYGSESSLAKGIALTSLTATPFFVLGLTGIHPHLWLDLILGTAGICWSVYLLFTGIPTAMKIPSDRGFMYASAVLAVGLVIFLCLLGGSVILWDLGAAPVFID